MHPFCYQKVATRYRSVSVHSDSAMMHHVHTGEVVVTTQKIDIFWLVTTRLIAHSGQSELLGN